MNLNEYNDVKNYTYLQYCEYLQNKYGIGLSDYMTKSWNKNRKVSRTKEGLYAHHKYEDHAIMLSVPEYAKENPFEWQKKENIVYCNLLEHLFLHILICENPSADKNEYEQVGVGGVINFIVPELNDVYSGWVSKKEWQNICHNVIINDKAVYMVLLKRFKNLYGDFPHIIKRLYSSYNEQYGLWSDKKNTKLYKEIKKI